MPRVPAARDGFLPSKESIVCELEAPSLLLDGLWIVGVGPSKSGCPGEFGCSVGIIDPLLDAGRKVGCWVSIVMDPFSSDPSWSPQGLDQDQSTFPILFKGQKADEYSLESLLRNLR
jgi:hypothetical protein